MRRTRAVVVVAATILCVSAATAKPVKKPKPPRFPTIVSVDTPMGLQGVAGAGASVVIPFRLFDRKRRASDVEMQFAWDRNNDGLITSGSESVAPGLPPYLNEYETATEERLSSNDTRTSQGVYDAGLGDGADNAIVWHSTSDVPLWKFVDGYRMTPQGRLIGDPDHPGSFLYSTGINGNYSYPGIKIRLRSVWRRRHHRPAFGPWVYSSAFYLDNTRNPSMTIDAAVADVSDPTTFFVNWTAFHPDSEDQDGNGVLDVVEGEDRNGDGALDAARMGVAFDWHIVAPGADPSMTLAELSRLTWYPCTRKVGVGDTDSLEPEWWARPKSGDLAGVASAPPGVGRHWVFAWDTEAEGWPADGYMIRATPFDQWGNHGPMVYYPIVVHPSRP